jgi:hypothetical protein
MKLLMYLENDCIDAVALEPAFIVFPGYVGHFVRTLKRKHEHLLLQFNCEPEFLLHEICSTNPVQMFVLPQLQFLTQAV